MEVDMAEPKEVKTMLDRWGRAAIRGGSIALLFLAVVIGGYGIKSRLGVDLFKGSHFLIFPQESRFPRSLELSEAAGYVAQGQEKIIPGVSL